MTQEERQKIWEALPKGVQKLLTEQESIGPKQIASPAALVAGGFIRDVLSGIPPVDVDLFVDRDAIEVTSVASRFLPTGVQQMSEGKRVLTVRCPECLPVQLVMVREPLKFLQRFDFTVNCVGMWAGRKDYDAPSRLHTFEHPEFRGDLAARRLALVDEKNLTHRKSLQRMLKMYGKGYTAENATIAKLMAMVASAAWASMGRVGEEWVFEEAFRKYWECGEEVSVVKRALSPREVREGELDEPGEEEAPTPGQPDRVRDFAYEEALGEAPAPPPPNRWLVEAIRTDQVFGTAEYFQRIHQQGEEVERLRMQNPNTLRPTRLAAVGERDLWGDATAIPTRPPLDTIAATIQEMFGAPEFGNGPTQ